MPIFRLTYLVIIQPWLKFVVEAQDTIIYRLVIKTLIYQTLFLILIFGPLLAGKWGCQQWPHAFLMIFRFMISYLWSFIAFYVVRFIACRCYSCLPKFIYFKSNLKNNSKLGYYPGKWGYKTIFLDNQKNQRFLEFDFFCPDLRFHIMLIFTVLIYFYM